MKTPISATTADVGRRVPPWHASGFTLIELLVVLALLSLALAVVPTAFERLRESMAYRDAVRQVVSDMRVARQQAVMQGAETRFVVDLANRRFGVGGATLHPLPDSLQMRVVVAGIEWTADQNPAVRFLPQGGATGGTVEVVRSSGAGARLTVDWLSGSVSHTPIVP